MAGDFFDRVYAVVVQIPAGRVTCYGAIAAYLGTPRSSRAVGYAMNAAHNKPEIPAQRVVNRKGLLTGKHHFQGTNLMAQLLESEGVRIINDQVQDFNEVFWDPVKELPPLE